MSQSSLFLKSKGQSQSQFHSAMNQLQPTSSMNQFQSQSQLLNVKWSKNLLENKRKSSKLIESIGSIASAHKSQNEFNQLSSMIKRPKLRINYHELTDTIQFLPKFIQNLCQKYYLKSKF